MTLQEEIILITIKSLNPEDVKVLLEIKTKDGWISFDNLIMGENDSIAIRDIGDKTETPSFVKKSAIPNAFLRYFELGES